MRRLGLLLVTVAAAGCHRGPSCDLGKPFLTWFDAGGTAQLVARVDTTSAAAQVCDGQGHVLAQGRVDLNRTELTEPDGRVVAAEFHRSGGEPTLSGHRTLRLHGEKAGLVRLLDASGVPVGAFAGNPMDGGTHWDPGGNVVAKLEWAGGRWVVHDRESHVVGYVGGTSSPPAAAAFALQALSPVERATLGLWIDRNSPGGPR